MLRRHARAVLVATVLAPTISLSAQLDVPNAELGFKLAFLVDPVGARIELTEGLAGR